MHAVAIIPARSGSKRIPGKNIKPFAGKPIIAYSIKAAKATGLFSRIIASTDSDEIAEVAKSFGAEAPFMRPTELADDHTGTVPVLLHALTWLKDHGNLPEYFCCIYPTAPFLRSQDLEKGFELVREKDAVIAFSVTTFPYPIFRALNVDNKGRIKMLWENHKDTRSNDLPETYHDAGQFYWAHTERFMQEKELFSVDTVPVVLPRYLVQDIDTHEDWKTAELMYTALRMREKE